MTFSDRRRKHLYNWKETGQLRMIILINNIGKAALEAEGEVAWNKRVKKMLTVFKTVFNYDHLYIGGGNSRRIKIKLEKNVTLVSNKDGIKGGAKLWQHSQPAPVKKATK